MKDYLAFCVIKKILKIKIKKKLKKLKKILCY